MNNNITITVSGPINSGITTIATCITHLLNALEIKNTFDDGDEITLTTLQVATNIETLKPNLNVTINAVPTRRIDLPNDVDNSMEGNLL